MISISEYLNENLDEFVFELKNQTYLNAAKKQRNLVIHEQKSSCKHLKTILIKN